MPPKPEDLGLIPRAHMLKERNQLPQPASHVHMGALGHQCPPPTKGGETIERSTETAQLDRPLEPGDKPGRLCHPEGLRLQ